MSVYFFQYNEFERDNFFTVSSHFEFRSFMIKIIFEKTTYVLETTYRYRRITQLSRRSLHTGKYLRAKV